MDPLLGIIDLLQVVLLGDDLALPGLGRSSRTGLASGVIGVLIVFLVTAFLLGVILEFLAVNVVSFLHSLFVVDFFRSFGLALLGLGLCAERSETWLEIWRMERC